MSIRTFSTSRISAFGRRLTKTTKRKPWRASYVGVQARELGEHLGVGVGALLRGRARREARRLPDRRVGVEHLVLLVVGELGDHLGRVLERILALGEQLDEPRPPLEELGELLGAQLPR